MSDKSEILIRALEASGSEREAKLARAILGDPAASAGDPAVSAATPATPAAVPEVGTAVAPGPLPAGAPTPPPGKAPLVTMVDVDALSQAEVVARMDEVDFVLYGPKAG